MIAIGRESIAGMIPHAGTMCMLDAVVSWDATSLRCLSRAHRDPANPMRRPDGVLGAACGIEIAAQAMALHGRLLINASAPPVRGLLVSVRDVRLGAERLDAAAGDLIVDIERLRGDGHGATYRFMVTGEAIVLLSGQALVVFGAAA